VWVDEWDEDLAVDEAMAGLQDFFRVYTEITPEIKKTIADYVEQRAVIGIFSEKYRVRLGMILWPAAACRRPPLRQVFVKGVQLIPLLFYRHAGQV
jgi:hypothetical protein